MVVKLLLSIGWFKEPGPNVTVNILENLTT